jgi:TetR/AcrR family transcriptional regulator
MGRHAHSRRPRSRNSAETRAAILGAAERIFADVGLAGARTDAIAAAAGVNKAMLYYYFRDKNALYAAVLEERLKDFYRQATAVLSSREPPGATLLRYVSTHIDFIGERPYYPRLFQRLIMGGGRQAERIIQQYLAPLAEKIVRLIGRGVRSGEFRPVDLNHTAISVASLTVFYFSAAPVVRTIAGMDPYDRSNLARRKAQVLEFIRYALFKDPEARTP